MPSRRNEHNKCKRHELLSAVTCHIFFVFAENSTSKGRTGSGVQEEEGNSKVFFPCMQSKFVLVADEGTLVNPIPMAQDGRKGAAFWTVPCTR
jgi:hypothetical protein